MKLAVGSTQVRVAPPSRARLLRLAEAGSRLASRPGKYYSPHIAAICDALQLALAQNAVLQREVVSLRQRLAAAQGWGDEPTRKSDSQTYPGLVARTTRTDLHRIAEPDRDD